MAAIVPSCVVRDLLAENLALRQQLAVLKRTAPRPRLQLRDRLFWAGLAAIWSRWRSALAIVEPATVVRWHRLGFRLFWAWKSRGGGRPRAEAELRSLVRRMAAENPTWGAPRIHGELQKLGYRVAESTVSKYMPRRRRGGSGGGTWRTFVQNHLGESVAIDFFAIPNVTFRVLYGFVIVDHARRKILDLAVVARPTAEWVANRLLGAFPWDTAPRFLHHDRDPLFRGVVRRRLEAMGIEAIVSAPRSPRQNAFAERVIGSIRRELLDHVIVLNEEHAARLLRAYQAYYNADRTHLGLDKDTPDGRAIEPRSAGPVIAKAVLGGLHHRYNRAQV